jgi:hypothetical protein
MFGVDGVVGCEAVTNIINIRYGLATGARKMIDN